MSDNEPQHGQQNPYDPYAQPYDPYAQQAPYDRPDPYAQQQYRYEQQQQQQPYGQEPSQGQGQGRHQGQGQSQGHYGHAPYDGYGNGTHDAYGTPQQAAHHPQPANPQTQVWDAPTWETGTHQPLPDASAQTSQFPAQPPAAPPPAPAPAPAAAPSAPTPASTAHLAPNQRARAEGRSPIIPPGMKPAVLTAALALLLALAAPLPRPALLVPVALLQAVTAAGWFRLNGMWPARQGIALAFLAGLTTDVALLATDRGDAPLVAIGTLGVWCLFVLVLQLRNRSSADERMYALTAGLTSTALVVLASGQLAAGAHAVVVGAAAVALATLARALPLPAVASVAVALVAAAGAGIAAGQLTGLGAGGALLGLAAGGCALIGLRVASYDYPSRFVHLTAGVALPLALAAPAVYVLGRALG
ncbi:hypothetical protein ACIQNI_00260 [Streptomyces sp. NPDC091266]|uniref:hypothetical protein n=1 Tax=Streptomyces sp. NPDC091266 TaxID=3365978 RepID=UPI0037FE29AD